AWWRSFAFSCPCACERETLGVSASVASARARTSTNNFFMDSSSNSGEVLKGTAHGGPPYIFGGLSRLGVRATDGKRGARRSRSTTAGTGGAVRICRSSVFEPKPFTCRGGRADGLRVCKWAGGRVYT